MSRDGRRERFTWTPDLLERVDHLEPCERVPHEPHADEHGSCPGFATGEDEREVERRLEEAHFDVGEDSYGDWFSGP
jgi:hypothetical protein